MHEYKDKIAESTAIVPDKNTGRRPSLVLQDNRPKSILQRKQQGSLQTQSSETPVQKKSNNTGLPDNLKSGIENLSGHSMDDVKVHYNSDKPAQLNAHAYAQGTDIHVASGQEKHLAHEAWHVVQQKQGRVKPTTQLKGKMNVNDDTGLEKEADVMGARAMQMKRKNITVPDTKNGAGEQAGVVQLKPIDIVVTGITHLVKMVNGSIMGGQEADEITHGTPVTIDNEIKYRSRRGPNQEIFGGEDKFKGQNYRWYKVLKIGAENVSGQNLFIRDETFQTATHDEVVSVRPAQISGDHRLRDPHLNAEEFSGHFTRKASEMPPEYSGAIRQHVVKQWVQTKLRNVISVVEDKGNKGKNNKGVFRVHTREGEYVVKVAVAPASREFESEARKRDGNEAGLGAESDLFAQIIVSESNWHGLTLGLYPAAPGITLGQGFSDFTRGMLSADRITAMFERVASELSRFHLANEKEGHYNTAGKMASDRGGLRSHNDANPSNVLIHPVSGKVTFIDNDGLSVAATPGAVDRDVSDLMLLFTPDIGKNAGLEAKAKGVGADPHTHPAQHIMAVVLDIIGRIKGLYEARIKNARVAAPIKETCDQKAGLIKAAFDHNK